MFQHNFNPILVSIGPFDIYWYGVVWALGFILSYIILRKNHKLLNLTLKQVETLFTLLILGAVVGARLIHVIFWNPSDYLSNPLKIFALWEGGLAFHGGLAGVLIVVYYFTKKHNVSFYKLADVLTLPAAFALALGRIANFINAELVGRATNVSWCVEFPNHEGCRHPSQIYAAIGRFISFAILYLVAQKNYRQGTIFWLFVLLFGLVRIFVDFFREDYTILALTMGQWLSLIMVFASLWWFWNSKKDVEKNA